MFEEWNIVWLIKSSVPSFEKYFLNFLQYTSHIRIGRVQSFTEIANGVHREHTESTENMEREIS